MNPDYHIEHFWLDFKTSMNNFYNVFKITPRPIQLWSDNLNYYQKNKEYDIIENKIRDYMSLYAIDVMRSHSNYYMGILQSNIKRWNSVSLKYNFKIDETKKYYNIVYLLLDIYSSITNKFEYMDESIINIFSMVEMYIMYEDFTQLVIYSIEHNKPSIIDKLNKYVNINHIIEKQFNIVINNNSCGKKIISLIKNNET